MAGDLVISGVSRRFHDVVALDHTTLHVAGGQFVALLGPSGCGKTTTLRIVAGFEHADTGSVSIDGRDISALPVNKRRLGMMFQDYALFPHMTVDRNISFGLRMARMGRAEMEERVRKVLDLIQLRGFEDRYPNQLSGGQQQRVALARSLVTDPAVLLLDEPLAALDKNLRESMQFELKRIQARLGITTVMVTHDQEEALTLSDEVAVMHKGRILQKGTPHQVYESPATRFVSEFLGAANIFTGEVQDQHPNVMAVSTSAGPGFDIRIPTIPGTARRVSVGVRPEKVTVTAERPENDNVLPCTVDGHVFRGTSHSYEFTVNGLPDRLVAFQQSSDRLITSVFAPGDRVWIGWDVCNSFAFEAE